MDDKGFQPDDDRDSGGATLSRRGFFGRAFAVVGAGAALLTLSGCPGGEQDDDDDDGDDD